MKLRRSLAAAAALAVAIALPAHARSPGSDLSEPFALGLQAGSVISGTIGQALFAGLSFDIPAGHPLSIMFEPSVFWVSGANGGVFRLSLDAALRLYLFSPFVSEDRPAHWGPFIAGGAAVSWVPQQTSNFLDVIAFGPYVEAGYRLVFADHGIFVEPAAAWTTLYGARLDPAGPSAVTSNGLFVSLAVGYRF